MSLAQIVLVGYLGSDADTRHTSNGKKVTSFSLPISEGRDKPTEWFKVEAWDLNDIVVQCLAKGRQVTVVGKLVPQEWTTNDGLVKRQLVVKYPQIQLGEAPKAERQSTQPLQQQATQYFSNDVPF